MRGRDEKGEMKRLFTADYTLQTLFEVFKKKDYNRITHRLRTYQSIVLYLQAPSLSDMHDLQKVHSNLRDLDFNIREIGLSIDEMTEDWNSLGLGLYAEALDFLMETLKVLHQRLARDTKDILFNNRIEHLKFQKKSSNVCEQCSENHQATHLKRLKTSFGLLYPDAGDDKNKFSLPIDKEDLTLREKEDFIDQINFLLQKKPSIANLTVNTKNYKELVDCLSKMEKIDGQLGRKERKKTIMSEESDFSQMFEDEQDNEEALQSKYHQIIEEVKNILNGKFRDGYSQRIRNMLDKFEIVLKSDQMKKIEKKNLINVRDEESQTLPTTQSAQLIILREEIIKRDIELNGLKEGRKKIEEKYLKLLESERRISREASSNSAKNEKLIRELEQKDKEIDQLEKDLGKSNMEKRKKFDILAFEQEYEKSLAAKTTQTSRTNDKKLSNDLSVRFIDRDQKNSQTQTEIASTNEPGLEPKKKNFKMVKRFSIIPNSNHFISNLSEIDNKNFQIVHVLQLCLESFRSNPIQTSQSIDDLLSHSQSNLKKISSKGKKGKKSQKIIAKKKEQPRVNSKGANDGHKFNKSIDMLHKQDMDEIIVERSEKSLEDSQSSMNNEHRSSIFNLKSSRESRDFKNMNCIRLTELPKYFRLNHLKTDTSKTKDESGYQSTTNREKEAIIRINKYQKKNSSTLDRDRVKEIVNLLKIQKDCFSKKKSLKPIEINDKLQSQEDRPKAAAELAEIQISLKQDDKEDVNEVKEDVTETIENLKILIESEYTYLKASGFINFLLTFQKKPSLVNRNLIKYKFEFTHLSENEIYLFGGVDQMIRFTQNAGIWRKYMIDENDLKLYYKHINFAHKISKYFLLLKKMNQQYFEEYVNFLIDPLNFSLSHFGKDTVNAINAILPQADREREDKDILASNELNWKKIMMRLIRFHHETHKNCKHIVEFLDKIGYYRYSI